MLKGIAELLSNIRVAYIGRKSTCAVRRNKFVDIVLDILLNHGYIAGYKFENSRKAIVHLRYFSGYSIFKSMVLISTPRRRVSIGRFELLKYKHNQFMILSTKDGIITRDDALMRGIGGIMLFTIY